jgi:intracellular septation protein
MDACSSRAIPVMKVFLEYIPLVLFLLLYKLDPRTFVLGGQELSIGGIYSATAMLMLSTVLVYGFYLVKEKGLTRMQWIVVIAVLLFGSTTLLLRSEDILKWKAPAVNWLIGAIFIGSQYVGKKNMAESMFGHVVNMPAGRWKRLNLGWALTFFVVGSTNLFVAFNFHDYWVDFKVFGSFGMLLLATIAQMVYIYPYLEQEETAPPPKPADEGSDSA